MVKKTNNKTKGRTKKIIKSNMIKNKLLMQFRKCLLFIRNNKKKYVYQKEVFRNLRKRSYNRMGFSFENKLILDFMR